jgi:ketosteroid isomerase-like protein
MMPLLAVLLLASGPDKPPTAPRAVVHAMFEAFNRHDAAGIARLYAPSARLTSPDFCTARGQRDVQRTYAALFAAFPDIRDDVQDMVVEGERVAVRFVALSTAGKLALPVQAMIRVRDGRIILDDAVFDTGGKACEP